MADTPPHPTRQSRPPGPWSLYLSRVGVFAKIAARGVTSTCRVPPAPTESSIAYAQLPPRAPSPPQSVQSVQQVPPAGQSTAFRASQDRFPGPIPLSQIRNRSPGSVHGDQRSVADTARGSIARCLDQRSDLVRDQGLDRSFPLACQDDLPFRLPAVVGRRAIPGRRSLSRRC